MSNAAESLDLSSCDREPIHLLGAIQPLGFLIAVSREWQIVRVSDNVKQYIGRATSELLGLPLAKVFDREAIHKLRNRLVQVYGVDGLQRVFAVALLPDQPERRFDCAIHEVGGLTIIEAEPSDPIDSSEVAGLVRAMIGRLDDAGDLAKFLQQGARQVHGLTGFDRVMVYRFNHDDSGEVVAEVARSGMAPLLGFHYPASDIPRQARALYLRTPFRIICNVDAVPAAIVPPLDEAGEPLDLSLSVLRAVSPIHLAYLRNMGVVASLSISIIVEGRLWGLFACHHHAPRCPAFDLRTLTELFGQMFSLRLESRERRAAAMEQTRARQTGDRMIAAIAGDVGLLNDPDWLMMTIGDILPCDGVGVSLKGRVASSGVAPPIDVLPAIAGELGRIDPGQVFATDHLVTVVPDAYVGGDPPAGMLAIPISSESNDYVMLFRRQRIRAVTWAGNPHKPEAEQPAVALSPRASFAAWREEVRERSDPFTAAEHSVAETLRVSLTEVVLRLAGAAVVERQRASQRQEVLIAELNHRVRNILALINGLVRKSSDPSITLSDYMDVLEGRILALARAHDQITQDNWGPAPLRQLFEAEGAQYIDAGRVTLAGPPVTLEPLAFSTLALVVHEMMTNSAKYGALCTDERVDIDWSIDAAGDLLLLWTEHGGPAADGPRRSGLGTTIIEQSIPHDLGGVAALVHEGEALHARFVIPSRYVRPGIAFPAAAERLPDPATDMVATGAPSIDGTVLVVEDSLLIAIHVEDILRQIGITGVATAATVAAALAEMQRAAPAAAILDFNLGDTNSLPVADVLRSKGIPYLFATGYGDDLALPADHLGVPVLQKPYTKANLAAALSHLAKR